MKTRRILPILLLLILTLLVGCASTQLQSPIVTTQQPLPPNVVKTVVDALCPTPVVPDPRGDALAGFLDRFNKYRANMTLTQAQLDDYAFLKAVCSKDIAARTDYEYFYLAGSVADQALTQLAPFAGSSLVSIAGALGIVIPK